MPLVLPGTLLAFAVYAGQGTAATTQLTTDLWQHCFHAFTHARIDLSGLLDVDIEAVPKALLALLQDPSKLAPSPDEYLQNGQGLLLLNALLSTAKLVVSSTAAVLVLAKVAAPNVPTSKAAGNWDFADDGGVGRVLEIMELEPEDEDEDEGEEAKTKAKTKAEAKTKADEEVEEGAGKGAGSAGAASATANPLTRTSPMEVAV